MLLLLSFDKFPVKSFEGVVATLLLEDEEFVDDVGDDITDADLLFSSGFFIFLSFSSLLSLEWLFVRLGLGEGELELVDVGVPESLSVKWSSFGGDDASICPPTSSRSNSSYIKSFSSKSGSWLQST